MRIKHLLCLVLVLGMCCSGCDWGFSLDNLAKKNGGSEQKDSPASSASVESDWVFKVDQTMKYHAHDTDYIMTLKINAVKELGTEALGRYNGTIYYKLEHVLPPEDATGYNYSECPEQAITFELVPYNQKEYDAFGQKVKSGALAPLGNLESMCLQKQILNGRWKYHIAGEAGAIDKDVANSVKMDLRIGVAGGIVMVDVIMPGDSVPGFQGAIVPRPIKK
ncbi:MAG: hypothetical protein ABFD04_13875 [Syntrophomonas sp.]